MSLSEDEKIDMLQNNSLWVFLQKYWIAVVIIQAHFQVMQNLESLCEMGMFNQENAYAQVMKTFFLWRRDQKYVGEKHLGTSKFLKKYVLHDIWGLVWSTRR